MKRTFVFCNLLLACLFSMATPIPLHCMIVGNLGGDCSVDYPHTPDEVRDIVAKAGQIFTQAAISFQISSIGITNYSNIGELYSNDAGRLGQICSTMENTDGLELYFVPNLVDAAGVFTEEGIVISGEANFRTVAHEIGHAFGWPDIYVDRPGTFRTVQGAPTESRMPQDHGFFPDGTLQSDIVRRLLMYGVGSETKGRIPRGAVDGIWIPPAESPGGSRHIRFGLVPVGMFDAVNHRPRSL